MSREIQDLVQNCRRCAQERNRSYEPLIPSALPERPWQRVATDLLHLKGSTYLAVVDYYSRYIELAKLSPSGTDSPGTIERLKSMFARHGIPEELVSDGGPQYKSAEFAKFASSYGFVHTMSSPGYPRANGGAERAVQTVKDRLRKADDPYLALMLYRNTPLNIGATPTQLLMSRKIRTIIPTAPEELMPKLVNTDIISEQDHNYKTRFNDQHDRHHAARDLPPLVPGDTVFIRDSGVVQRAAETPWSYVIDTPTTSLRRNRGDLIKEPEQQPEVEPEFRRSSDGPQSSPRVTRRSSRVTKKTERLIEQE